VQQFQRLRPYADATSQVHAASSAGGALVVTQDISPGTVLCSDTNVVFTVVDACSNLVTCTVPCVLTMCSNCPPVQCPTNVVVDCDDDAGAAVVFPPVIAPPFRRNFLRHQAQRFRLRHTGHLHRHEFVRHGLHLHVRRGGARLGQQGRRALVKSNCGNSPLTQGNAIAVDRDGSAFVAEYFRAPSASPISVAPGFHHPPGRTVFSRNTIRWAICFGSGRLPGRAMKLCWESPPIRRATAMWSAVLTALGGFSRPGIPVLRRQSGAGGSDVFLAKYNPDGGVIWYATAGGSAGTMAKAWRWMMPAIVISPGSFPARQTSAPLR